LRGLSVFAGGWTLDGAEVVASAADIAAAEVRDLLNHLVDKSLVIARDASGGIRYHMLERFASMATPSSMSRTKAICTTMLI